MSNTFGHILRVTTWGESHGPATGALIEGLPAGLALDELAIQKEMQRRRPGQSSLSSSRHEPDTVQILSGLLAGKTLGTPLMLLIPNSDTRSQDYQELQEVFRPSHGDFTWQCKYGYRDWRGGGRSGARETAARVAAGAIAKQLLTKLCGTEIVAWVSRTGNVALADNQQEHYALHLHSQQLDENGCPDAAVGQAMQKLAQDCRQSGDSCGGCLDFAIRGLPPGLGEPCFDKFEAVLAQAFLSLPACKAFEFGRGFAAARLSGSEHNDAFRPAPAAGPGYPPAAPATNRAGGLLAGISTGAIIYGRIAFKPTPSIARPQESVNTRGEPVTIAVRGRHDACFLPRAVPIVEAMAALSAADLLLQSKLNRMDFLSQ